MPRCRKRRRVVVQRLLGPRKGDCAEQAMMDLVGSELVKRFGRPGQAPRRTLESGAPRPRTPRARSREIAVPIGGWGSGPAPCYYTFDPPSLPAVFLPSL